MVQIAAGHGMFRLGEHFIFTSGISGERRIAAELHTPHPLGLEFTCGASCKH